jgi:hypothetical protein
LSITVTLLKGKMEYGPVSAFHANPDGSFTSPSCLDREIPLDPVVIPPIPNVINGKIFTCAGSGLMYEGHSFSTVLPYTVTPELPKVWWQAQCIFQGLDDKGTVAELKERLMGREITMDPRMVLAQQMADRRFREKNKKYSDALGEGYKLLEEDYCEMFEKDMRTAEETAKAWFKDGPGAPGVYERMMKEAKTADVDTETGEGDSQRQSTEGKKVDADTKAAKKIH